ncbi:hypothetical protein JAAARDRAFT_53142 [Jaapia argillacea MUCL 33604]|uniref:Magnesium transporter n=1 Tax=Jaapia argillacea MUCL 33604 TaxID=933084 RepID=A0A067Q7D1_9AGAM|nr:hypothetical protein JAAARDRAFT_53142 [Jaapia argillacea MUCL 33604]
MPRENSFSDEGRSLTPDLDEEYDVAPTSPAEQPRPSLQVLPPATTDNENTNRHGFPPQAPAEIYSAPADIPTRPTMTPKERFRASVRKVIHMRSMITATTAGAVGAEPGVDPRRHSAFLTYGHLREKCVIEVIDYSGTNISTGKMTNSEFVELLRDKRASTREPWVKVRWINVGGISWDVMSALAIKYDLHPLALEDVLHQRGHARSKADYYSKHLFLRVLCHTLAPSEASVAASTYTDLPRSASPDPMQNSLEDDRTNSDDEKTQFGGGSSTGLNSRFSTKRRNGTLRRDATFSEKPGFDVEMVEADTLKIPAPARTQLIRKMTANRKREQYVLTVDELKKDGRVPVKIAPMCIFLLRDGTVISINHTPSLELTAPIAARLRAPDTTLRISADASLLVQSLLDLIVDAALEIIDEYQGKILKLEEQVLMRPKMKTVRALHIISGDLSLYKRTLEPIRTLVYGLRRYDVDRCAALIDPEKFDEKVKVQGFMSHKSKIYLADVVDHMEYILGSLDMFATVAENLINFTFNMTACQTNEVMRRLTLVTIIFLPLTFLSGYFGMNFHNFWSVQNHSDRMFWEIAMPCVVAVVALFMWPDLVRLCHFLQKKVIAKNVAKACAAVLRTVNFY